MSQENTKSLSNNDVSGQMPGVMLRAKTVIEQGWHYINGTDARKNGLIYLLPDAMISLSGFFMQSPETGKRNWAKVVSGILNAAQSLFFMSDRGRSEDEKIQRVADSLDAVLEHAYVDEQQRIILDAAHGAESPLVAFVRDNAIKLGVGAMTASGALMTYSGVNGMSNGSRRINFGEIFTGLVNMVAYGVLLPKMDERPMEEGLKPTQLEFWKQLFRRAPGQVSRATASLTSLTGIAGGAQDLIQRGTHKVPLSSSLSQIGASSIYLKGDSLMSDVGEALKQDQIASHMAFSSEGLYHKIAEIVDRHAGRLGMEDKTELLRSVAEHLASHSPVKLTDAAQIKTSLEEAMQPSIAKV